LEDIRYQGLSLHANVSTSESFKKNRFRMCQSQS